MAAAGPTVLDGFDSLDFTLGQDGLGVSLTGHSVAAPLTAPLRFQVAGTGQVLGKAPVTVPSTSTTTLAVDVRTSTARPAISADTRTVSHADLDLSTALDDDVLQAGVGDLSLAASGSTATLGIDVTTAYDDTTGVLKTTRSTTRGNGFAANADLVLTTTDADGDPEHLTYSALPTDSSGGGGATQPAPEAMQVKYIAEGLDGLATALGNAMDGGAVRNLGPDGAPVAAPLIGTDLDAGAGVAGTLTGLTSSLRDALEGLDATTPDTLVTELQDAVDTAVAGADGVGADGAAVATVDCQGPARTTTDPRGGTRSRCASASPATRSTPPRPSTSAWPASRCGPTRRWTPRPPGRCRSPAAQARRRARRSSSARRRPAASTPPPACPTAASTPSSATCPALLTPDEADARRCRRRRRHP